MTDLKNRTAVIAGASRGLGVALAHELARRGAAVALVARSTAALADVANGIAQVGVKTLAVPADITDAADRDGVVEQVERHLGPIDVLVNNASIARATSFVDENPERVIATNLTGPLALTRLVVPGMAARGSGAVLNVASLAGKAALPYLVAYSASKAGLISASLALREELRGSGVSVTVVSPGFIVDAGMYLPYATSVPWYLGSNRSSRIARRAVRAMVRERGEVILNTVPQRPLLAVGAVSERAFRSVVRRLGLTDYLRRLSDKGLPYSDDPDLIAEAQGEAA